MMAIFKIPFPVFAMSKLRNHLTRWNLVCIRILILSISIRFCKLRIRGLEISNRCISVYKTSFFSLCIFLTARFCCRGIRNGLFVVVVVVVVAVVVLLLLLWKLLWLTRNDKKYVSFVHLEQSPIGGCGPRVPKQQRPRGTQRPIGLCSRWRKL